MNVATAWLVLGIFVVFFERWVAGLKRFVALPGVLWLGPLIIISAWVLKDIEYIFWLLNWVSVGILEFNHFLRAHHVMYGSIKGVLVTAWMVTVISLIPTGLILCASKPFRPFRPPYMMSIACWMILVAMLTSSLGLGVPHR